MRILAVADRVEPRLHDDWGHTQFAGIDLILACGDLPPEYPTFLRATFQTPLAYVRGNHDIRHRSTPPQGCVDLHRRIEVFGGFRVAGLEGSRWYNGGPVQYTELQMRWLVRKLRWSLWRAEGVDCILAHAPPRHIHDAEDPCHRGFRAFHTLIDRYQPAYFIHGHIHAHFNTAQDRITRVGRTQVINAYGHYLFDWPQP